MLFLVSYYVLAAILLFQGLHVFGEVDSPLGTLPEETAQAPVAAQRWGGYLMTYAGLMVISGLTALECTWFEPTLRPLRFFGFLSLALYGAWIVFKGRTIEFMGKPTLDDAHGHGHH